MASLAQSTQKLNEDEVDADAVLAELEAEEDQNSSYRQQRVEEHNNASSKPAKDGSFGFMPTSTKQEVYMTLKSDDETLRFTTEHERAIVHFFHPDFARCSIMDEHLTTISDRHGVYGGAEGSGEGIAFGKVNVNNAPFVVERLGVRVLPCVIGFADGGVKGKVIGFEGVCWDGKEKDHKVTQALEDTFVGWQVLKKSLLKNDDASDTESDEERIGNGRRNLNTRRGIKGRKQALLDEDDDWD